MNRQGLCGPGKNGVLPIFSRRKRPRQAVYADPSLNGQSSSEQLQTDNRQTARSSNCFSYYNSSKSQSAKKTELGSSVDKRTEQSHQATKPPYNTANRQYAPPLIRHPGQNQQLQNKGMHYAQAQHAETRQISQLTDRPRNRSYVQNSSNNHHDRSYTQQNFSNNNNIQPRSILKQPQGFNSNRQPATSNFHTHPFQQHRKTQSLALNTVTSHGYCNTQALAINRQDPIGPLRPQELPAVDNTKPKPKIDHETDDVRIKTAADDKSLRILTASIEGMLHWKKSTKLNLLFEVYGVVDSAVLSSSDGSAKEFNLRDGKVSIKCTFFEIDRPMPRVTRGQWYRCVGNLDTSTPIFRCVSIRPAAEQEKKLIKVNIATSDKAMREATAVCREA